MAGAETRVFHHRFTWRATVSNAKSLDFFPREELQAIARLVAAYLRVLGDRAMFHSTETRFLSENFDQLFSILDRCFTFIAQFPEIMTAEQEHSAWLEADNPFHHELQLRTILQNEALFHFRVQQIQRQGPRREQLKQLVRLLRVGGIKDPEEGPEEDCFWQPIDALLGLN